MVAKVKVNVLPFHQFNCPTVMLQTTLFSKLRCLIIVFISNSNLDTTNATLPPIHYETESRLNSIKCCELEICDILKSLDLNKASGADGISPWMLKYTASSIYPSLTRLFNISLEQKIYPSVWKNANVTPLYNKGDASLVNNYRPISMLSAVSKVMEKAIFKHTFILSEIIIYYILYSPVLCLVIAPPISLSTYTMFSLKL